MIIAIKIMRGITMKGKLFILLTIISMVGCASATKPADTPAVKEKEAVTKKVDTPSTNKETALKPTQAKTTNVQEKKTTPAKTTTSTTKMVLRLALFNNQQQANVAVEGVKNIVPARSFSIHKLKSNNTTYAVVSVFDNNGALKQAEQKLTQQGENFNDDFHNFTMTNSTSQSGNVVIRLGLFNNQQQAEALAKKLNELTKLNVISYTVYINDNSNAMYGTTIILNSLNEVEQAKQKLMQYSNLIADDSYYFEIPRT
jgi:L-rhamnose mutarotase